MMATMDQQQQLAVHGHESVAKVTSSEEEDAEENATGLNSAANAPSCDIAEVTDENAAPKSVVEVSSCDVAEVTDGNLEKVAGLNSAVQVSPCGLPEESVENSGKVTGLDSVAKTFSCDLAEENVGDFRKVASLDNGAEVSPCDLIEEIIESSDKIVDFGSVVEVPSYGVTEETVASSDKVVDFDNVVEVSTCDLTEDTVESRGKVDISGEVEDSESVDRVPSVEVEENVAGQEGINNVARLSVVAEETSAALVDEDTESRNATKVELVEEITVVLDRGAVPGASAVLGTTVENGGSLSSELMDVALPEVEKRQQQPPPPVLVQEVFHKGPMALQEVVRNNVLPTIVLEEARDKLQLELSPIANGAGVCAARKSPVTVQEWVDSLPAPVHRSEDDSEEPPLDDADDVLDLGLGAEAGLLYDVACPAVTIVRPQVVPDVKNRGLAREPSVQSDNSHGSSVESYLESRKPDPEEVLMSLGFGGTVSPQDTEVSRIPRRFLQPSKVKGVAIEDFLRYQQDLIETFETGFCGYHGLSGSMDSMPSVIVAKIMEKLREHERESCGSGAASEEASTPASPPPKEAAKGRFSNVARRVLKRTSVLGAIPSRQATSLSVLNPDNRRFLESQGAKSPEVPRKRMVIGHRSYTFGCDGEMIEVTKPKPLLHKDSVLSSATSLSLTSVDSDSDTDERSDIYELHRHPRLPPAPLGSPEMEQSTDRSPQNKRTSSTSISSWESDTDLKGRPHKSRFTLDQPVRYESIDEDVEMKAGNDVEEKVPDSVFEPEPETPSRRGSLKRQQHISEEEEVMEVISETKEDTNSHLNVVPDQRGDSFEMEEIGMLEDEAKSVPLSRARSDSSGFLEGDPEHADTTRLRGGGDVKRLSLPVVRVHDEKGSLLISRSCSLHSLESSSSDGGLHHRSQSVPNALSLRGSWSSVSNMFSSCSDESVIHVGVPPSADLQELLRELAGRGVSLSPGARSQPVGQSSRCEADAVRLALGAYSNQLVGGTSSLELLDCGPPEARREIQMVREIRGQIAAELRRVASLLEEQPGPRAAAITRQMTALLREQTRLCRQLESLSQGYVDLPSYSAHCCNSEHLLGTMREENRRLERLVESHSQELSEIRQLLQQLVARNS